MPFYLLIVLCVYFSMCVLADMNVCVNDFVMILSMTIYKAKFIYYYKALKVFYYVAKVNRDKVKIISFLLDFYG